MAVLAAATVAVLLALALAVPGGWWGLVAHAPLASHEDADAAITRDGGRSGAGRDEVSRTGDAQGESGRDERLQHMPRALGQSLAQDGGWTAPVRMEGSIEQVVPSMLASYRDGEPAVLAAQGALDLFGQVWGLVVRGGDWVEVCVVSEDEGGESCQVQVLRIEAEDVERVLEKTDGRTDAGDAAGAESP